MSAASDERSIIVGLSKPDHVEEGVTSQGQQSPYREFPADDEGDATDYAGSDEPAGNSGSGGRKSISTSPKTTSLGSQSPESKKRMAESVTTRYGKAKRLKGLYNNDYRNLLNSEITRIVSLDTTGDTYDAIPTSQIGVSIWTFAEKEIFFSVLPRLGKDNIRGIATRIGSKSAIEVREYIRLLQRGVEQIVTEERYQLSGSIDIPSAIQVSEECCDFLEKSADALALRQERHEENTGRAKWGESWLLTSEINDWVEEHLADEDGNHALNETLPAANFLNLGMWLQLSKRIFMNPAEPHTDENWQFLIEPDEEPGIRATAFTDFYTLAVSLTKRLVSTTIFCAMSRLRATDAVSKEQREDITKADVHVAVRTLGLELNSSKFWTGCARRCKLNVYQNLSDIQKNVSKMEYDDVEHALSQFRGKGRSTTSPIMPSDDDQSDTENMSSADSLESESSKRANTDNDFDTDIDSNIQESKHLSALQTRRDLAAEYTSEMQIGPLDPSDSEFEDVHTQVNRIQQHLRRKEEQARATDRYLEAVDLKASLAEEKALWKMLKQNPPFAIQPDDIEIPDLPARERKTGEEVADWRNRLEFWSEWETFETPVPREAFALRGTERKRPDQGSGVEDGDEHHRHVVGGPPSS